MFGQQPQYGGYGRQPQPAQQSGGQLDSLDDIVAGSGAKSFFNQYSQPGASVSGVIDDVEVQHYHDYNTKEPAYWKDGRPMQQIRIVLQTQLRDPELDDDDGRRSLYIKGWGLQLKAFRDARRKAGMSRSPRRGDRMAATFRGYDPQSANPANPAKLYEYVLDPVDEVDAMLGGPTPAPQAQQTVQQPAGGPIAPQPQFGYPQPAFAPQQGAQPVPGGGVDPWSGRPMQQAAPVQTGMSGQQPLMQQPVMPQPVMPQPQAPQPAPSMPAQPMPAQPQQGAQPDAQQVMQLKALGKPPQEIARLLNTSVEQVTMITDAANPAMHGGSEQEPEF